MTASFASGSTSASVRVPVLPDGIVEPDEEFDLRLTLLPSTPSGIRLGTNRATGVITDSTSKVVVYRCKLINITCHFQSVSTFSRLHIEF